MAILNLSILRSDHGASANGILATAHRLMFVAAGLAALCVVALTAWGDSGAPLHSPLVSARLWHVHEMMFGFAAAGFAGYTLTAMASWTGGRLPTARSVLLLAVLWLVARAAAAGLLGSAPWVFVPAGLGFTFWVAILLGRAALATRVPRGCVQAGFAALLVLFQVLILTGAADSTPPVLGFALLLSVVGGKMVAAFTRNRIEPSPSQVLRFRLATTFGVVGSVAIVTALLGEVVWGSWSLHVGVALLVAGAAEGLRLAALQDRAVRREGLLAMLHLGYLWLPVGLCLMGAMYLEWVDGLVPDLLHALTAGAVACLIWAVAARAEARRADHLRARPLSMIGFALLWLSAALRVVQTAPQLPDWASPVLWCLAWGIFVVLHLDTWRRPSPRPVFSGPRRS
jgi:uncharacterized protein involved in response to NO